MTRERFDAIVLGAGAAGLMAAARAGQMGRRVCVLERADRPGRKILISGGGRCNFTNLGASPANYLSANPHFAKSALARYTARDFLDLVERHGIAWHEKTLGQLFCDGSAQQIVDMLLEECARASDVGGDVSIRCGQNVTAVSREDDRFVVETDQGPITAPALVIATGGPSIPKMGATGFAYDLARQFGLKIVEPRPALVPLTLGGEEVLFREISGVSAPVVAKAGTASFPEAALFTHRGLSGPAILQASSYWKPGDNVTVDFLPDR
ncbi:MAG: NAD(P)/FAD-dependent oxidoreductase, partial [Erythrobacter sp.]|nr:NAD(P)/FAD-dependent oxidoreductase [Erythrobacter sp.]